MPIREPRSARRRPAGFPQAEPIRPGGGRSRTQIEGDQRRRLLDAMAAAMVEHGYEETRVADVLEFARASRSTFYRFFESKRHCFEVAYDDALLELTECILIASRGEAEWAGRVRAAVRAGLLFLADRPARARLFAVEALAAGPIEAERHHAAVRRLAMSLSSAPGTPETDGAPGVAESVIAAGLALLISERILAGEAERLPQLEDGFTGAILMAHPARA